MLKILEQPLADNVFVYQVVAQTWVGRRVRDFTLYSGTLGTAFLLFKAYQVNHNRDDLALCAEIVKACDSASSHSKYSLYPPWPS